MAIAGGTASYTISIASDFTLTTDLLAVNLAKGGALTLQGNEHTIDGAHTYRGLFDYAGVLIVDNLTRQPDNSRHHRTGRPRRRR
jgi:hypothetical protein